MLISKLGLWPLFSSMHGSGVSPRADHPACSPGGAGGRQQEHPGLQQLSLIPAPGAHASLLNSFFLAA